MGNPQVRAVVKHAICQDAGRSTHRLDVAMRNSVRGSLRTNGLGTKNSHRGWHDTLNKQEFTNLTTDCTCKDYFRRLIGDAMV